MSVRRLVGDASRGDEGAWDELVDRYSGLVWAVVRAHRLNETDAADASQATWLKLAENLRSLREPAALGKWLATTARRESLHVLRHGGRLMPCDDTPDLIDPSPEPAFELLQRERDRQLWRAFSRLSARDQALLRLLTADPAPTYREIGAALDMPVGSIGPTRSRALERLRAEVDRLALSRESWR